MTNNSKKLRASKLLVFEFFNSHGWEWPGERSPTCRCNLSNIYKCNSVNPDIKEVKDCRSIFTALVLKSWRNQQTGRLFPNMCEVKYLIRSCKSNWWSFRKRVTNSYTTESGEVDTTFLLRRSFCKSGRTGLCSTGLQTSLRHELLQFEYFIKDVFYLLGYLEHSGYWHVYI